MAEENSNPVFQIQRMYLKDLSLEIPHAPHIFLEQAQPTVEVAIDNGHEKLADGIYEVTITVTVTTRIDEERVVFLVEGKQAGIFEIRNIPEDQMDVVLNIVCPNTDPPGRDQLRSALPAAPGRCPAAGWCRQPGQRRPAGEGREPLGHHALSTH